MPIDYIASFFERPVARLLSDYYEIEVEIVSEAMKALIVTLQDNGYYYNQHNNTFGNENYSFILSHNFSHADRWLRIGLKRPEPFGETTTRRIAIDDLGAVKTVSLELDSDIAQVHIEAMGSCLHREFRLAYSALGLAIKGKAKELTAAVLDPVEARLRLTRLRLRPTSVYAFHFGVSWKKRNKLQESTDAEALRPFTKDRRSPLGAQEHLLLSSQPRRQKTSSVAGGLKGRDPEPARSYRLPGPGRSCRGRAGSRLDS